MALSTELDAVNEMLATIGEAPVNDLKTASTSDVAFAVQILDRTTREVQSEGWSFNTDKDFTLVPNGSNEIAVPPNALRVTLDSRWSTDVLPVVRGRKLYDRKNHTYTFTKEVKATEIVYLLNFSEIPQTIRWYITVRASRKFQDKVRGSDSLHAYTERDELSARRQAMKDQGQADHVNMLDAPGTREIVRRSFWR